MHDERLYPVSLLWPVDVILSREPRQAGEREYFKNHLDDDGKTMFSRIIKRIPRQIQNE